MKWRIEQCISKNAVYLRHEVRGYWEGAVRQKYIDRLGPHQVVIVLDWKMKFLMSLFRESMVEFFGKAGRLICSVETCGFLNTMRHL